MTENTGSEAPLTEEELREGAKRLDDIWKRWHRQHPDLDQLASQAFDDVPFLLSELERTREREAELERKLREQDKDFAYAIVMTKLTAVTPVVKLVEEGLRRLEGDAGWEVGHAISSAINDAHLFALQQAKEAREAEDTP